MKHLKRAAVIVILVVAVYFLPLVVVDVKGADGSVWKGPVFSSLSSVDNDSVTFSSIRSAYALGKDGENAMHYHTENTCRGISYYYDEGNDVSYYEVDSDASFPLNSVTLKYEPGDACEGWTTNDEVAWPFGDIRDVDWNITPQEAMDKDWLVIVDGKAQNPGVYNDFSNMVKQGVYCLIRTVIYEGDSVSSVVDIQMMEIEVEGQDTDATMAGVQKNTGNSFHVSIRTADDVSEDDYIRLSDNEENGKKPVLVYKENDAGAEGTLLYTVQ